MSSSFYDIGTVMGAAHLLGTSKKVTERRNGRRDLEAALGDTDLVRDIHETDAQNRGLLHHQLAPSVERARTPDAVISARKTLTWARVVRLVTQGVEVEVSAGKSVSTGVSRSHRRRVAQALTHLLLRQRSTKKQQRPEA